MESEIMKYEIRFIPELDEFEELVHSLEFRYSSRHLLIAGIEVAEMPETIARAMRACKNAGIETRDHFRSLYIVDEKTSGVFRDWRLTRQGFALCIMSAAGVNKTIACCQWELANNSMIKI